MTTLTFNEPPTERDILSSGDIQKIVQVCANAGYTISARDARRAWEAHSEASCANWILLDSEPDEYIVMYVRARCEEL
jgi:hypothetical protein